jgi:23S rRNA pseudouridine2457 synthase
VGVDWVLIAFHKPFQVLSQFTDSSGRRTLAEFISNKRVYPLGRLDWDSEGLLLLSDEAHLVRQLSDARAGVFKTCTRTLACFM